MAPPTTTLTGNASDEVKFAVAYKWDNWMGGPNSRGFGRDVKQVMRFTTLNIYEEPVSQGREGKTGRAVKRTSEAVHEATVTEDFLNGMGLMHGGCVAFLIDNCTSAALIALDPPMNGPLPSLSINLSITYHAPAATGAPLRFISTVVAFNARVSTARCEVWDTSRAKHRLIATGVHIAMHSSDEGALPLSNEELKAWKDLRDVSETLRTSDNSVKERSSRAAKL